MNSKTNRQEAGLATPNFCQATAPSSDIVGETKQWPEWGTKEEELTPALTRYLGPNNHVVYIWMSNGWKVGHGSLLLNNNVYISWWPKGLLEKYSFLKNIGYGCTSLRDDIYKKEIEPEYVFKIPSVKVPDSEEMTTYWRTWLKEGYYSLLFMNCCSLVYNVLLKGGAPLSRTVIWRPETLRRYLVIFLGGGSESQLYWNLPTTDYQYKGSLTLFIWSPHPNQEGHVALLQDNDDDVIPFPPSREDIVPANCIPINHNVWRSRKDADIKLTFRPKYLDLCAMKRCCKDHAKERMTQLTGANSFWFCYQLLTAGGAPRQPVSRSYWCAQTL